MYHLLTPFLANRLERFEVPRCSSRLDDVSGAQGASELWAGTPTYTVIGGLHLSSSRKTHNFPKVYITNKM